ncbi:MAG: hypothetical protein ACYTEZ_15305 [Planctomycetota bacterium]|jgi:hypothetical protein
MSGELRYDSYLHTDVLEDAVHDLGVGEDGDDAELDPAPGTRERLDLEDLADQAGRNTSVAAAA